MKKTILYLFTIVFVLALGSCAKDGGDGPLGAEGRPGAKGEQGIEGKQGIPGTDGKMIHHGDIPPTASIGAEGDFYIDKKNSNLYGPKTSTGWGVGSSMKGADGQDGKDGSKGDKGDTGAAGKDGAKGDKGDTGAAGSQFLSGTTDPTNALGKAGDFYFNRTSGTLFGPKTATWAAGVNLKGPKGDKGDKGDVGNANVQTMGWTIVTMPWWKTTDINGLNSNGNVKVLNPGDVDLRYVEQIFMVNEPEVFLSGAVLVYADNGMGIRMLPFQEELKRGIYTGTLEYRFLYKDKDIYIVVALKQGGVWDKNYIENTYLPSIKWKVVMIPNLVASAQADALSKLNLNNYKAVSTHFNLKD